MPFDIASLGLNLGKSILDTLKNDSGKVKALAIKEGETLAQCLAKIAELLANGDIDREEAAIMVGVQKDASEAVLSMLAEISRVSARKAVTKALKGAVTLVDGAAGVPFLGTVLKVLSK